MYKENEVLPEFNISCPESLSSITYAEIVLAYISGGSAAFDDPFISITTDEFYDRSKDEYRKNNGNKTFIVPGKVVRGESTTVRRQNLETRTPIDKICYPAIKALTLLVGPHTRIKWNEEGTADIDPQILNKLKESMY